MSDRTKRLACAIADGNISALLDGLNLTEEERQFAEEKGTAFFKEFVGSYSEEVKKLGQPRLRPVAISAALAWAMIAVETFAQSRGHH